jgi:hypothetical protein
MKDFAKTKGRTCPLNLGPRILILLFLELAEESFILISDFEALKKSVFPGIKLCKSAGYESKTLTYIHVKL